MKSFLTIILVLLASAALAQPVEEWVARYNGPGNSSDGAEALALDPSGNIYVTGYSEGSGANLDYATIKYDSDGDTVWVARYDGPGNGRDCADALALDDSGNVYVTGDSYNPSTYSDYLTIKYDSGGNQLWVAGYNGPGNWGDQATALALDSRGNIYVTGHSDGGATAYDYTTIKYDSAGNRLWVSRYNGPANDGDLATALALDVVGDVYVTGWSHGSGTREDYATIKYDSAGNELWVGRYQGGGGDFAQALTLDASGNVYVTGWGSGDYATIKYDTDGNELWVARYNGPGNADDGAQALALDASGNVYVTGYSESGSGWSTRDYATIKYNSLGSELWVARYNGPADSTDQASALALDNYGCVYVTGSSYASGTGSDYATIKYDPDGNEVWLVRYDGPGYGRDIPLDLAIDIERNVYVTGTSDGSWTEGDYATIKYSQPPLVQLTCKTAAPWFCRGREFAFRLTVANNTGDNISGTLVFAGYSGHDCDPGNVLINIPRSGTYPPGVRRQYYFLKLPHALVPGKYSISVGGTLSDYEVFCCANTRIVQCSPWKSGGNTEWELVEVDALELESSLPASASLSQCHPNPFNLITLIEYQLPEASDVKLDVYNLLGEKVITLVDEKQDAGYRSVTWDASEVSSGIYFYKLTAGDFTDTRRMMLVK